MSESAHHAHRAAAPRNAAEFAREIGAGISAAFVLLAMMLPLGLIAFAPAGSYAVEAGLRAALAAAIFGNLTAFVLSGALLPNEVPRASSVFLFSAFILRLWKDHPVVEDVIFLAALCLVVTGVIQILFGLLRLGNIARFVPYPVVAGLMTGLAISLIWYEIPEVLGTHGGGGGDAGAADAHHGVNGWTVLVGIASSQPCGSS